MEKLEEQFAQFIGVEAEPPRVARYDVNAAMIRNWVEAHDDFNPIYIDAEAARATGRRDVICPPAMISTWVMSGYRRWREVQRLRAEGVTEDFAYSRLLAMLDDAGFTDTTVGTVDRFQGREAPVAILTMAASSPQEVPRGLDFLLDRNRLNVSVSRGKWACYLVHSPALADALPTNPADLPMIGAFLRLIHR